MDSLEQQLASLSPAQRRLIEHWLRQQPPEPVTLPASGSIPRRCSSEACSLSFAQLRLWLLQQLALFGLEQTRSLLDTIQRLRPEDIQVSDILLAALAQTYARWTGERQFLAQLTNHGRFPLFDDVDLSRTASFISFHFPMFLDIAGKSTALEVVEAIKQQIRGLPRHGIGYGLLRQLSGDEQLIARLQELPAPEISFNYFGQQRRGENSWSRPAHESAGPTQDPLQSRLTFLYCRARVADERLSIDWGYSEHVHTRATIEGLAEAYMDVLRAIMSGYDRK